MPNLLSCYCRGVATCGNCEEHICTGQCQCDDIDQTKEKS
jgi:hypothetical protein